MIWSIIIYGLSMSSIICLVGYCGGHVIQFISDTITDSME